MAASSRSRRSSGPVLRSLSPSAKFHSSSSTPSSSSSSAFASSTSTFSSRSTTFLHRSTSPTRVNLYGSPPPAPSVKILTRPADLAKPVDLCVVAGTEQGGFVAGEPEAYLIGTVEGDLVRRALAALIRPSSHQQRRRGAFQPRPSRLSVMSKAAY
ncbi:hypothetical protein Acr_00g0076100 [Actinidia rufa]|uniref:Uncharacterized protein n=1 Tax=Actinidia rufa TaxID=165716 RepID=A0A7J0DSW5_9ERIC|nr:hypothetical protein Acr_00g0076100 [Actinidia rufa]